MNSSCGPVVLAVLLLVTAGCGRRIKPGGDFTWKVILLPSVDPGGRFAFEVEAFRPDGHAARDATFYWEIEWVGVRSGREKGKTFKTEEVRARGKAGTATLRIFAADPDATLVEVAVNPFEVK